MPASRVVNTEIFFQMLVKFLKPALICDIGTLDASHSVLLRHISKFARILAFEANPYNFKRILDKGIAAAENIEVFHKAVTSEPGSLIFHVQQYKDRNDQDWMAGTSSIRQRSVEVGTTETTHVDAVRLDEFLIELDPQIMSKSIALWIDVEGAGYEVLEGISSIASSVLFIQIEVETEEIWQGQKLKNEVLELAVQLGFVDIARGKHDEQHDLILINKRFLANNRRKCERLTKLAVIFYYLRKWGGHILCDLLLIPVLGIWRRG